MADKSAIEWTDATWNPITGCTVVSPGCTNCYAMKLAGSRLRNHPSRKGLTKVVNDKTVWTGEVRFNEAWLNQPAAWKSPKEVFVCDGERVQLMRRVGKKKAGRLLDGIEHNGMPVPRA